MTKKCLKKLNMFVLDYTVSIKDTGKYYVGCAVVKAGSASQAVSTFKAQSNFNGYQKDIKISAIKEIYPSPETMLCCEDYIEKTL